MANRKHLGILHQGVGVWNQWREKNSNIAPNLAGADLEGRNLRGANLTSVSLTGARLAYADLRGADLTRVISSRVNLGGANLSRANLTGSILVRSTLMDADLRGACLRSTLLDETDLTRANLTDADLRQARFPRANLSRAILCGSNLTGANLSGADLSDADLGRANLNEADLSEAILSDADLRGANLHRAKLTRAILVGTRLENANLEGCSIFGISAWDLKLEGAIQSNLKITSDKEEQPTITVDNLEVAQFIYLILNNEKIRDVINTITTKVVLILGRFTPERKAVLDAIREELRKKNYLPVVFDFDTPASRDTQETITTLARLARFIIADITSPKSIPQELVSIVESLPSVPIQPLLKYGSRPWGMFDHIKRYPWVLPIVRYKQTSKLLVCLGDKVIAPAETKAKELEKT